MKDLAIFYAAEFAVAGFILFLLPYMTPRRIYFGITVAPDFRDSPEGRAIMRHYRIFIALAFVVTAAAVAVLHLEGVAAAPLMAGFMVYLWARDRAKRFAAPAPTIREASLAPDDERLPRWFALAAVPYLVPIAAAAYLNAHWSGIPERFPVHWGANGVPNRWVEKSVHAVYGPAWGAVALLTILVMLSIAMFFGSRRSDMRKVTLKMVLAAEFVVGLIFGMVALLPLLKIPIWMLLAPSIILPVAILTWAVGYVSKSNREAEVTPDACWHWGQIYYNPDDPALFVQKRIGFGYTFNFANQGSWMILSGLVVMILAMVVVLP